MKKLFVICPECYIEQAIRTAFDDCFFITALGSVCSILGKPFWQELDDFVAREGIEEVYIVGYYACGFIDSAFNLKPDTDTNTEAQRYLTKLSLSNLNDASNIEDKKIALCKENLTESAKNWLEQSSQMKERISKNKVKLEGLLFNRDKQSFSPVPMHE